MKRLLLVFFIVVLGYAVSAQKQNNDVRIGLAASIHGINLMTLESPLLYREVSIGAQIDISRLISIRPLICLFSDTYKVTMSFNGLPEYIDTKTFSIGGQIDVPFNFLRFDNTSIYAGPSIIFINISNKGYNQLNATTTYLDSESNRNVFGAGAIIGGSHAITKNFSLYLDFGLLYMNVSEKNKWYNALGVLTDERFYTDDYLFFTGPSVGLILYFK